ncbi:MAG: bifunctional DNA-formamidopyrimidine glycosylase/DNA-(apurinic or apyrimidinic site) lyase, partial [Armatimonadota bacterium]
MPELPEVETVRRDLSRSLVGREIRSLAVTQPDVLRCTGPVRLVSVVVGRSVEAVRRTGKNLVVALSRDAALLINLGMTGQLFVTDTDDHSEQHTHLVAALSDGRALVYRDVRRFGSIELVTGRPVEQSETLRNVGVDALSDALDAQRLQELLGWRRALLKNALLNQSLVAGLGNIYVCESLHRAGIHPATRCNELSAEQFQALHAAIGGVLREAIAAEGTTISDYVTGKRVPGR